MACSSLPHVQSLFLNTCITFATLNLSISSAFISERLKT